MLKIGDFSKLSRVSIRMLRHYDEIGLLKPVWIDPESGYRYYAAEQLPIAGRISALKDMGFGLAAIGEILPCYLDRDALDRHLRCKEAELQEVSSQTAYRLRLLDTARKRLRKEDETMNYDITIKTFPARYAATVPMRKWMQSMLQLQPGFLTMDIRSMVRCLTSIMSVRTKPLTRTNM